MSPPLQLGPDPNRSYLERWNELHPDRYGRADTYDESASTWFQRDAEGGTSGDPASGSLLETLLGLAILVFAPLTGAIATFLLYRWIGPDHLTSGWVLGYAGAFLACSFATALLVYALRRIVLAAVLLGITLGVAYLGWNLLVV